MSWIESFQLKANAWAKERGIFEHSTVSAQLLKALSEAGEVADAIVKADRSELIDGIGDVLVCLANAAGMAERQLNWQPGALLPGAAADVRCFELVRAVLEVHSSWQYEPASRGKQPLDYVGLALDYAVRKLDQLAMLHAIELEACAEVAWLAIRDRKGRMVEGGAFVKEGDR